MHPSSGKKDVSRGRWDSPLKSDNFSWHPLSFVHSPSRGLGEEAGAIHACRQSSHFAAMRMRHAKDGEQKDRGSRPRWCHGVVPAVRRPLGCLCERIELLCLSHCSRVCLLHAAKQNLNRYIMKGNTRNMK